MKVKMFSNTYLSKLSDEINKFISDKHVYDIKINVLPQGMVVLVMYDEEMNEPMGVQCVKTEFSKDEVVTDV